MATPSVGENASCGHCSHFLYLYHLFRHFLRSSKLTSIYRCYVLSYKFKEQYKGEDTEKNS
ncbi:hypothetical protein E7X19_09575 [Bacteroides fragilis]|nr:hypothetical protein DXD74_18930 [Bacteroides fragilis]RHM84270.1 hypothetical protein DWZ39_17510 [Bacteroides fragilis]THC64406.1 hypothetical protein E7X03_09055 [Bacteroides fragilis]THC74178.1 hypothetical protein E7X19_09575 [Bacteroides fragilis]THC85222.1 hypothetical protein E7X23_09260 [Bacteroides fragilis]